MITISADRARGERARRCRTLSTGGRRHRKAVARRTPSAVPSRANPTIAMRLEQRGHEGAVLASRTE